MPIVQKFLKIVNNIIQINKLAKFATTAMIKLMEIV